MWKFKFVSEWLSEIDAWTAFETVAAVVGFGIITAIGMIGFATM